MPKARVLTLMPTLGKRNDLLRQTLASIASQSEASDIVVVCPKNAKDTRALAKEFNCLVADDPGGISKAVNVGIAAAKPHHEFITWLGDDDLLTPDSLATSVATLDANPEAVVAFGYCDYIDLDNKRIITSKAGSLAPWIMTWGPDLVPMPGLVMRRSALKKAGEFDENNKWCMDLDILLRLRKLGKFINTKQTLACFRWHPNSQTVSSRPFVLDETEKVKRKYMSQMVRPFAFLWEKPVRIATNMAVKRMNKMAQRPR